MASLKSRRCPPAKTAAPTVPRSNPPEAGAPVKVVNTTKQQNPPPDNSKISVAQPSSGSTFTALGAESCGSLAALGLEKSSATSGDRGGLPPSGDVGEGFNDELILTNEQASIVIGKGGSTIQRIKLESRANLRVATERAMPDHNPLCIHALALHQVEKAKQLVLEKLAEYGKPLSDGGTAGAEASQHLTVKYDTRDGGRMVHCPKPWPPAESQIYKKPQRAGPPPPSSTTTADACIGSHYVLKLIEIPAEKFVLVNGENGEKLAQLRKDLKVKLVASLANPPNPVRLHINGLQDRVETAMEVLGKILDGSGEPNGGEGEAAPAVTDASSLPPIDVERESPVTPVEFIDSGELAKSGCSDSSSISKASLLSDASPRAERGARTGQTYAKEVGRDESLGVGSEAEAASALANQIEELKKSVDSLQAEVNALKLDRANAASSAEIWAKIKEELATLHTDLMELKTLQ